MINLSRQIGYLLHYLKSLILTMLISTVNNGLQGCRAAVTKIQKDKYKEKQNNSAKCRALWATCQVSLSENGVNGLVQAQNTGWGIRVRTYQMILKSHEGRKQSSLYLSNYLGNRQAIL